MQFILRKTPLAKFLTNGKRLLDKKENLIRMTFFDNTLSLRVENQNTIYQMDFPVELEESSLKISFLVDGREIDKLLNGSDRDILFEIKDNFLFCEELGLNTPIESVTSFPGNTRDKLSNLPFKDFTHTEEFYLSMVEANEYFLDNAQHYSNYLKFKDMISTIYNPELVYIRVRKFNNHIGVDEHVGNDGVALHKDSISFFIKSYKHAPNKELQFSFMTERNFFIFKEGDEYFCFRYNSDLEFPDILKLQHKWTGETIEFSEENLKELEDFVGKGNPQKIYLHINNNKCLIYFDSNKETKLTLQLNEKHFNTKRAYGFNFSTFMKVLKNDICGKTIHLSTFINQREEKGDFWKIDDDKRYIFLSGFEISSGLDLDDKTKELFKKQLENLDAELAILNKQKVTE